MKKALKIKLNSHAEFQKAWAALIKAGYHCGSQLVPHTAPYLYAYADGKILADFFDVDGADLSSTNSAAGYFAAHEHKEITLEELEKLAGLSEDNAKLQFQIDELESEITELKDDFISEHCWSDAEDDLSSIINKCIEFGMLRAKRDAHKLQQEQVCNEKHSSTTD